VGPLDEKKTKKKLQDKKTKRGTCNLEKGREFQEGDQDRRGEEEGGNGLKNHQR